MSRGDDRPRESSSRKKRTGPTCIECGYQWFKKAEDGEIAEYRLVRKKKGESTAEQYVHRVLEACRSHKLCCQLGVELGATPPPAWLFMRFPRERLLAEAEVRPKDWKRTGWMPRFTLDRRVSSLLLVSSWCYPVSMSYAVQTAGICPRVGRVDHDDDEPLIDGRTGLMYPLRQKEISLYLNEAQPSVSRAISRLVDTKEYSKDVDGVLSPAAKLLEMTIAERQALYAQDVRGVDEELKGVPKECRSWLLRIEEECEPDIRSVIFESIKGDTGWARTYLKDFRSEFKQRIKKSCGPALILIPDLFEKSRSSSSLGRIRTPEPPPEGSGSLRDDDAGTLNEQYATGIGVGAMSKLPPKPERPAVMIHKRLQHRLGSHLIDMVVPERIWGKAKAKGWNAAEVCVLIDEKGALARKKDSPVGFLETAVYNLMIPETLVIVRQKLAAAAAQELADRQRDETVIAENSVAEARELAFEARVAGMSAEDREARIARSMKRLAADAKANPPKKTGHSQPLAWNELTPEIRRARAESAAMRELREELDTETSAKGGT